MALIENDFQTQSKSGLNLDSPALLKDTAIHFGGKRLSITSGVG